MMLILLVVLWLLGVLARDAPRKDTNYVVKRIKSCPDVGYFFKREASPNALDARVCYLCFCQNDGTAVCWQRENKRCDAAHYQHGIGKRDARVRRSPIGLSDIFFRDAARDMFNKQQPEVCKPYETSFSEGCPPADWCVGCTVCDCDAHGRWDCHVLSFCPDKKDKSKIRRLKKPLKKGIPKRTTVDINEDDGPPTLTTNKNVPKRTTLQRNTTVKTRKQINSNAKNVLRVEQPNKNVKQINKFKPKSHNSTQVNKLKTKRKISTKIHKLKPKSNNSTQIKRHTSPKPLIIKKDTISKTPKVVNHLTIEQMNSNDTEKITQEVFKKVISAMKTFLDKRISALQPKPTVQSVQKRSMVKRSTNNIKTTKNAKEKVNGKFKPISYKKKFTKPVEPKIINNKKKPIKADKKRVTTKKPNKVTKKNGKRTKRDVSDYNITETVVIENSSYINTVPVPTVLNSTLVTTETATNKTGKNNYYKYSMITPTFSIVTDNPEQYQIVYALAKDKINNNYNISHMLKKRDKEKHFDEIQAMLNFTGSDINNNTILDSQKSVVESMTDFNDLKFNNWPQVKLLKNSLIIKKLVRVNFTKSYKQTSNQTETNQELIMKKHPQTKDISRVLSPPFRKYNRSKIIKTLSCNTHNSLNSNRGNFRNQFYHKIDDLQNVLKKVLSEFRKNSTTKIKQKPKRFNVIKYLKKFFGKLFRRYNTNKKHTIDEQTELNNHIIDSICESFSNCDLSQKNNVVLRSKINQLNSESYTIIKTIKIIKGLLHLLDVPTNADLIDTHKLKSNNGKSNLKDDILKLNSVLKDKYTNSNASLTSTQMTQIRYIKNNTQLFVKTVGRFANILNEIITILTKNHNIEVSNKHSFKTTKRSYENNRKLKNDTIRDFKQLKGLLKKYNLIQNTFVRKMYKLLSKFEKVHEDDTITKLRNESRVPRASIDHLSINIINNLRNLKKLANMLNSRRKRDTVRDDDAMEYLLTLMEYLIKQNYPLDVAPVNDGIDLLIEAIKSAPDIKPIKKKVLQSMPVNIRISRTTEPTPLSMLKDDSSSDSKRVSEDVSSNDTRLETGEQSSYQEIEKEDNFKFQQIKNIFETEAVTTKKVQFDKGETMITSNHIDSTVVPGTYGIFGNVEETTEYNNFKKFEQLTKENGRKFEVFNSDLEDEDTEITSTLTSTTAVDLELEKDSTVTVAVPLETSSPIITLADIKTEQYTNSADISGSSDGEKRVGLDWLDEGYEDSKEIRQVKIDTTSQTAEPVTTTVKSTLVNNVSTVTKEERDEEEKKRKSKINVEDVMFKKQMDLLNSLDYGTERSETDEQESKEGDERYSGDTFPAYFV